MEAFATKWFTLFYFATGFVFFVQGSVGLLKSITLTELFHPKLEPHKPPRLLLKWLRYALLFGMTSLVLSFWAASIVPTLFSLGILIPTFVIGRWLVQWEYIYPLVAESKARLHRSIKRLSSFLWVLGVLSLLLGWLNVNS